MSLRKAARLQHCGGSEEARGLDEIADHVGTIAKPSSQPGQAVPIRAELIGSDKCTAVGLTAHGSAPVLGLCRELVSAGHDPAMLLEAWRGDILCLRVHSIGEAARLTVEDDRHGRPRLRRWRARGCGGRSPVAQISEGAVLLAICITPPTRAT